MKNISQFVGIYMFNIYFFFIFWPRMFSCGFNGDIYVQYSIYKEKSKHLVCKFIRPEGCEMLDKPVVLYIASISEMMDPGDRWWWLLCL